MGCSNSSFQDGTRPPRALRYVDGDGGRHTFEAKDGRLLLAVDDAYPPKRITSLRLSRSSTGARLYEDSFGSAFLDRQQLQHLEALASFAGVELHEEVRDIAARSNEPPPKRLSGVLWPAAEPGAVERRLSESAIYPPASTSPAASPAARSPAGSAAELAAWAASRETTASAASPVAGGEQACERPVDSVARRSSSKSERDGDQRAQVEHTPKKPSSARRTRDAGAPFAIGDWAKIWSVSRNRWIYGTITAEDSVCFTVQYSSPDGDKEKRIPRGHAHIQPVVDGEVPHRTWQVMGKYTMNMEPDAIMGEGSSSICRRGVLDETGQVVAIKVYKLTPDFANKEGGDDDEECDWEAITLQKFARQIEVLSDLQAPWVVPREPNLWNDQLEAEDPQNLFMKLLDFSKDAKGAPAKDADDDLLYVITELAEYSLMDFLDGQREKNDPLSRETVRTLTRSIVRIVAGLHAKGYVHLDIKPENLMVFAGVLKLIDVDGCMKIGARVSLFDPSISCSPVYCAPEWAEFCTDESDDPHQVMRPHFDVWSVGITICELVTLKPVLLAKYTSFYDKNEDVGVLFMTWLSKQEVPPCVDVVEAFDQDLAAFLYGSLLICDSSARQSLAQAMLHPYIADVADDSELPKQAARQRIHGMDRCMKHGPVWKLRDDGDPNVEQHWTQRDVWVAGNGALYYYSCTDNKPIRLLTFAELRSADVTALAGCGVKGHHHFTVSYERDDGSGRAQLRLSCPTLMERDAWVALLNEVKAGEQPSRVALSGMSRIRLAVRNRRAVIRGGDATRSASGAVLKGTLWKLNVGGDRTAECDWKQRDMWIAKSGALCYRSLKEQEELVYYDADDMCVAAITLPSAEGCAKPHTFQIFVASKPGFEAEPSEFAADSKEIRDRWVEELRKKVKKKKRSGHVIREFIAGADVRRLGLDFRSSPPEPAVVQHVNPSSWAAQCGMRSGDEVVELNDAGVAGMDQDAFTELLHARPLKCGVVLAERRVDTRGDGEMMTKEEFVQKYGGEVEWKSSERQVHRRRSSFAPRAARASIVSSEAGRRGSAEEGPVVVALRTYDVKDRSAKSVGRKKVSSGKSKKPAAA